MAKALREVFGEALRELGAENEKVVVLDADLSGATRSILFGQAYPDRFFNVGIAEANMIGVAAGLASAGFQFPAGTESPGSDPQPGMLSQSECQVCGHQRRLVRLR